MFSRLLIANRGEIACRVIRTARRLGVHTIAVYSDADVGARHVRLADEAWRLGPAAPRDSYLSVERVLCVARDAAADAIHPGYGFLSENAAFAAACAAADIGFVGPTAAAMAAMGSKSAAKQVMQRAGVPVLPGYHGDDQSRERLRREALALGFPLLIKPSGGGGGKGMQIVAGEAGLDGALDAALRLAASAFADSSLLLERYLPAPRHVEVQILCDTHGRALHLHTRDCSVQRRHQKLIEEAPAPDLGADTRARLHGAALTAAATVDYVGAGTVEFLCDGDAFWFLEMNTRLQVEHGVTERLFDIDLVEWQLRIAAGEALPFAQPELLPRGHAIEARICAEDPRACFAPCGGRLDHVRWPAESADLRVDAGFDGGDEVPSEYDSLLGKLIAGGGGRREAILALRRGLDSLRIAGVETNAAWLAAALASPAFAEAAPTTRFVEDLSGALSAVRGPDADDLSLAAAVFALDLGVPAPAERSPWAAGDGFRINLAPLRTLQLLVDGAARRVTATPAGSGLRLATDLGNRLVTIAADGAGPTLDAAIDGVRRKRDWFRAGDRLWLWRGAERLQFDLDDPRRATQLAPIQEGELITRLPGTIAAVLVAAGERVEAGATLVVVEAMKMEHAVRAPRAGLVVRVHYAPGDRVVEGAVLVDFADPDPDPDSAQAPD